MSILQELIASGDVIAIKAFMDEYGLVLENDMLVARSEASLEKVRAARTFWNQRQQARKILLNSLYGALLNEAMRFYSEPLGQSVTMTGRSIARHMGAKTNEVITGEYDHLGSAITYQDTDSVYFSCAPSFRGTENERYLSDRDGMIELYDGIADLVNDSFAEFMQRSFNTSRERGAIIKAGRELIASKALFIKKKKYACLVYDLEGKRYDTGNNPGKLKAMGLELKRADTPKFMQKFLEEIIMNLLTDVSKESIYEDIRNFRSAFKDRPAFEKGSPKKVSGLTRYRALMSNEAYLNPETQRKKGEKAKPTVPGHVRASINWNRLCEANNDRYSMRITDGSRIVVCKLKPNSLKMDSVAFPVDEPHLPAWFHALPFDHAAMEEVIIDNKINNIVHVLDWDLTETNPSMGEEFFVFG